MKLFRFILFILILICITSYGKDIDFAYADSSGFVPRSDYGKVYPYVGQLNLSARTSTKIKSIWDGQNSLLYGFIDQNGKVICEPCYNDVELLRYGEKYVYLLTTGNPRESNDVRYMIIGADGGFAYEYTSKEFDYYGFFEESDTTHREQNGYEYIPVVEDGKWGVVDYDGKQILPYVYQNAPLFSEGLAAVLDSSYSHDFAQYYFIDSSGKKILGPYLFYDSSFGSLKYLAFYKGRAMYFDSNDTSDGFGFGYIDKLGRRIVEPIYDFFPYIRPTFKYAETAIVGAILPYTEDGYQAVHCAIVDRDGTLLTPMMLGEMRLSSDGFYELSGGMKPDKEYFYLDGTKIPYSSDYSYTSDGWFANMSGGKVYNEIIGEISKTARHRNDYEIFSKIIAADIRQRYGDLYGIESKDGETALKAAYNYLTHIGEYFLAIQGDFGGLIDIHGNWLIKTSLVSDSAKAEQQKGNQKTDYEYTIEDKTITITKYIGTAITVEIPSRIDGIKVTAIGERAFRGCIGLKSVIIPDSITSIGYEAFYECEALTSVSIPDSVATIGENAFYKCAALTTVSIPDSVTKIGKNAFYGCFRLKKEEEIIIRTG